MKLICFATLGLLFGLNALADSVFAHINSPSFKEEAKAFYGSQVASNTQRNKLIAAAKDECGGRYEEPEIQVIELSHSIEIDKNIARDDNENNYTMNYDATSENVFLVIENANCSLHEGHSESVLHSRLVTGTETMTISYVFVNDEQVGNEQVSNVQHTYKLGAVQMKTSFKTPYGTVIP